MIQRVSSHYPVPPYFDLVYARVALFFSCSILRIHHKGQTLAFTVLIYALKRSATEVILNWSTFFLGHLKGLILLPCSVGSFTGQLMIVTSLEDESLIWILATVSHNFYTAYLSAFSKCGGSRINKEKITPIYHIPLVLWI